MFHHIVPNIEKLNESTRAFIVSRSLEPIMKHEALVFDTASQTKLGIFEFCFLC